MRDTNRDFTLTHMKSRKQQHAYGMGLGILLVDDVYPAFPNDCH
jgi:hypothetical protein